MTTMERQRQDAWAYGLVALNAAAVLVWVALMGSDLDVLVPFGTTSPIWLLPPAILVLLGCLGFWVYARAEPPQRSGRPLELLKLTSVMVLLPLVLYAFVAYVLFGPSGGHF